MPITRRRFLTGTGFSLTALIPVQANPFPPAPRQVTQAELELAAERHLLWHRKDPDGRQADFGGCNMTGLRFGRWELRHANFAGADLRGIQAVETRFFRAHMTGCDLSGAVLLDCDLRSVDLTRAKLVGAKILDTQYDWPSPFSEELPWYVGEGMSGAKLNQADLHRARINVSIADVDFSQGDLSQADLRGVFGPAHFEGADLSKADLSGSQLSESCFEGANVKSTNVQGAYLLNCDLRSEQIVVMRNAKSAKTGFSDEEA